MPIGTQAIQFCAIVQRHALRPAKSSTNLLGFKNDRRSLMVTECSKVEEASPDGLELSLLRVG